MVLTEREWRIILDAALTRIEKQEALIAALQEAGASQEAEIRLLREGIALRAQEIDRLKAENAALSELNSKLKASSQLSEERVKTLEKDVAKAKSRGKRNVILTAVGAVLLFAIL